MRQLDVLATTLVVVGALNWGLVAIARVGALNWGLVAIARFDLVAALFGMEFVETSPLSATVYGLVGLAALYLAVAWRGMQRRWHSAALATR